MLFVISTLKPHEEEQQRNTIVIFCTSLCPSEEEANSIWYSWTDEILEKQQILN